MGKNYMAFKSNLNPQFRSKFSEDIFNQKYRHEGAETWSTLARTLVEDVCKEYMTRDEKDQLVQYIDELKFIPGGRYLYYAGRQNHYWNNCGSYDTKLLTDKGWVKFGDVSGKEVNLLSPVDGKYKKSTVHPHGIQEVYRYTFAPLRGKSKIGYHAEFTENHKWLLRDGSVTEYLKVGDVVPANTMSLDKNDEAYAHGFVFGDGSSGGQLRLCGAKGQFLMRLTKTGGTVTYPDFAKGDPVIYYKQARNGLWKLLPDTDDAEYIASFIAGWLDADGSKGHVLNSTDKTALKWFREHAPYAGLVITGELRSQVRDITLGKYEYKDHKIYIQNYALGSAWAGFKVVDKEYLGEEEVYCPFEPEYNQIVINHGIRTFNCYLLRSEEDSREDWANLSWKAESCLMTGGGIGNDYSVYRGEGTPIAKTGGTASGPIPKMLMINEIGRRVMQGGSRRSAIYASLKESHPDIQQFLMAKDWASMPVGNTGKSIWDIKQDDFNFPAPLDMTNISVNYGTDWLLNFYKTGDVGEVFRTNVRQALKTAEPGFSFNFFDKENETLRNACTEVTSEDDSDVCNLGSMNMGRIESIAEFNDVTALATKFLVCGTLGADLPYEKVAETREKNRRLGAGIMGVHEWLIKRGHRYEANPEFHAWMHVYRGTSDRVSKEFADELSISRPVANRAIAPTGSIGILAGTSTGIEPIFAVAYKRRYLKSGTRWVYQYVVDSAAQELIDRYGADPENIESAIDLAEDYERRMKFQADVQDYVDMSISSTINLPAWGSKHNNENTVEAFTNTLAKYAPRMRGFTCYPDGSRGGQPLTSVPYAEAVDRLGEEFDEHVETHDICDISGSGGTCGV